MINEAPVPSRTIHSGGVEWIVQVMGATRSGTGSDAGAPLLYLSFAFVESPDSPRRDGIAVGRSLDDLSDEDLEALLMRARPHRIT